MTIALDDFTALQRKVEKLKKEKDKAEGAYEECLRRLKDEFGCDSLSDAESLLLKTQEEEQAALQEYNKEKRRFEKKHQSVLEGRGTEGWGSDQFMKDMHDRQRTAIKKMTKEKDNGDQT
jgi:CTP-dependent riboflavin kinase